MATTDGEPARSDSPVAFVLGGGGIRGAHQVGMVRALLERDIVPDMIIGTSAGSIQGAMLAANPTVDVWRTMADFWMDVVNTRVMHGSLRSVLDNARRLQIGFNSSDRLDRLLTRYLGRRTRIEDLAVPFQSCAASIERATARYFDSGPLVPAVTASCTIPGLWPPYKIGSEHYIDGGVVETVPVARAVSCGAATIYVLRLRQKEPALKPPRWPWQLGTMVYELSRRYRLGQVLNSRPDGVVVHVLPSGEDVLELRGSRSSPEAQADAIQRRVDVGYRQTVDYLDAIEQDRLPTLPSSATGVGVLRPPAASESIDNLVVAEPNPSPFVADKLDRHFDLYDRDHDGVVRADDFSAAAGRIAEAIGDRGRPAAIRELHDAFETYWRRLCQAADRDQGSDPAGGLSRDVFRYSLGRLAANDKTYAANLLPVVAAIMMAADWDHDGILSPSELRALLRAIGVQHDDEFIRTLIRRLDTNNDGVLNLDELSDAFHDYFVSAEVGAAGNLVFGRQTHRH